MYVSSKAYKIWRVLFERPNEWLTLSYLSHAVDMSSRQTSSVLQTMSCQNILKREVQPDRTIQIMLSGSDEELKELRRDVLTSFHEIDEVVIENIRSTLSTVGWTSAQDIALVTGYRGSRIHVAISLMDDVVSKGLGSSRMYMIESRGYCQYSQDTIDRG